MYWTIVIFLELKCSHSCLLDHYCAKKSEFINLFLDWLWMENVKEWIWWFMLLWAPFRDLILGCKKEQTRRKRHLWQHAFKIYNIDNDFTFSLDMHFDWKIVDCFQRREKHVLIDLIFIFVDASISVATNMIGMFSCRQRMYDSMITKMHFSVKSYRKTVLSFFCFCHRPDKHYVHPIE